MGGANTNETNGTHAGNGRAGEADAEWQANDEAARAKPTAYLSGRPMDVTGLSEAENVAWHVQCLQQMKTEMPVDRLKLILDTCGLQEKAEAQARL